MASTTFVSNVTRIVRAWLQDVNDCVYGPTAPITTLRGQMADPTSASNGPAQVALNPTLNYTAQTLGRHLAQERWNPCDYPWECPVDGTSDCTSAINACVADASAAGRGVYLPGLTFKANVELLSKFDILGAGMNKTIIIPFDSSKPAIKNMSKQGSANFWRRDRIAGLSLRQTGLTGDGLTFGDPALYTTGDEEIGRLDLESVEITGFNKGVFKTCGNIGNTYRNCRVQNNNYNHYAQSSDYADAGAPLMHSGFDEWHGGSYGYAGLANIFIKDRALGKGGWLFNGTDLEGSTGHNVVVLCNAQFNYLPGLVINGGWMEANASGGSITIDGLTGSITGLPRDLYLSGVQNANIKNGYLGKTTLLNGTNLVVEGCGSDTVTAGIYNMSRDASSTFSVKGWSYPTGLGDTLVSAPYAVVSDNTSTSYTAVFNTEPVSVVAPVLDATVLYGTACVGTIVSGGYDSSTVHDGLSFSVAQEYVVNGSANNITPTVTTVVDKYYAITYQARLVSGSSAFIYLSNIAAAQVIDHSEWRQYSCVKKATTTSTNLSANSAGASSTIRLGGAQIVQFDTAQAAYEYLYRGRLATNSDTRSALAPLSAFTQVGAAAGATLNSANVSVTLTNAGYTKICEANLLGDLVKIRADFMVAFNDLNTGAAQDQLSGFTTVAFASTAATPTQVFGNGTVTFRFVQQGATTVWDLQGSVTAGPATTIVLAGLVFIKR